MSTDAIFEKYATALGDIGADTRQLSGDAVLLALRLAIGDAYAAGSALADDLAAIVASQQQPDPDQRQQESLQAQIGRLNDWLQVHEPGLYISPGDTADATLAALGIRDRRIAELLADMDKLQADVDAEIAELQESLGAAQDAFARLPLIDYSQADHANGVAPNPTTTPEWNRNHPAWDGLSDMQMQTLYRLHIGNLRFRNLSKEDRIDLVGRVLRHLADGGEPVTGPQFDRLKPAWMPTAGAVVLLAESRKWQGLLDLVKAPA